MDKPNYAQIRANVEEAIKKMREPEIIVPNYGLTEEDYEFIRKMLKYFVDDLYRFGKSTKSINVISEEFSKVYQKVVHKRLYKGNLNE